MKKLHRTNRPWLALLITMAFIWIILSRLIEIQTVVTSLRQATPAWLLLALIAEMAHLFLLAALYQSAFIAVGIETGVRRLIPLLLRSLFMNVAFPSGGASGMAVFVSASRVEGETPARVVVGTILALIGDLAGFGAILLLTLLFLSLARDLAPYELTGALLFLLLIGGLATSILVSIWQPELLTKLLVWSVRLVNFFKKRAGQSLLDQNWTRAQIEALKEIAPTIQEEWQELLRGLSIALAAHIVRIMSLLLIFLAFGWAPNLGILLAGYGIGILFWIVSPTPQGIGVVEGFMTLVFSSLGVPTGIAIAVALAFRGVTFWLPLLLGFLFWSHKKTRDHIP